MLEELLALMREKELKYGTVFRLRVFSNGNAFVSEHESGKVAILIDDITNITQREIDYFAGYVPFDTVDMSRNLAANWD